MRSCRRVVMMGLRRRRACDRGRQLRTSPRQPTATNALVRRTREKVPHWRKIVWTQLCIKDPGVQLGIGLPFGLWREVQYPLISVSDHRLKVLTSGMDRFLRAGVGGWHLHPDQSGVVSLAESRLHPGDERATTHNEVEDPLLPVFERHTLQDAHPGVHVRQIGIQLPKRGARQSHLTLPDIPFSGCIFALLVLPFVFFAAEVLSSPPERNVGVPQVFSLFLSTPLMDQLRCTCTFMFLVDSLV